MEQEGQRRLPISPTAQAKIIFMAFPSGASILVSLAGLVAVITWRLREARAAVSLRKIIIPPLGMATGFCMFFIPAFRIPWAWASMAFLIGAVALAWPLLLTTRLIKQGDVVMMKRSSAFLADSPLARLFRDLRIHTLHENVDRTAATLGQYSLGEAFDTTARL